MTESAAEAHEALRSLAACYAAGVDHSEIGRVVELIARYPATFHLLGQGRYEVHGDRASGEVYCVANDYVPSDQGARNYVMYIRYEDEYRRDRGGPWKIEHRDVHPDWIETRQVRDAS
jgi:plasmid stabilization system protein ParE